MSGEKAAPRFNLFL